MTIRSSAYLLIIIFFFASCSQKSELDTPAPSNSRLPSLYSDTAGNVLLSWVESSDEGKATLNYSILDDNTWTRPEQITEGNDWFINWADYPTAIARNGSPLAAHWLKKTPGGSYAYNINLTINQGGEQWSDAITPHKDSTSTEHGFLSMLPWSDNGILAVWLDGRETAGRTNKEYGNLNKAMTFRGAIFNEHGEIINKWLIDEDVCDCCNTSLAPVTGGAVAVFRNRAENEIRDIYYTRLNEGTWSDPKPVANDNWNIAACPVNGPQVVAKDSTVLVAWFTGASGTQSVKAAISSDLGDTFSDPILINEGEAIGRVDAAITAKGDYLVSWMEDIGKGRAHLNVTNISGEGQTTFKVTEMSASRSSGFPQMETANGNAIVAWTSYDKDGVSEIKTKLFAVEPNF